MRSARHALSAAALSALVLGGLAAYDGFDFAAVQAAPRPTASIADVASARALSARGTAPTSTVAQAARPNPAAVAKITTSPPTLAITTKADTSVAAQVLKLVNTERKKAGCKSVTLDARLTAAAAGHAMDMATANYFSHTSKDGRSFVDRIEAQGYSKPRSENIAAGQPTVAAVMSAWMKSSGHRANILDCSATQMGAAGAKGGSYGVYWVQDFGRG